ncbi:MAG TPA: DinB family protein [Candidatus Limnocylindrales bacterium]|nr:DinB family protein [Candidatus Limnocylindrales bacterium]
MTTAEMDRAKQNVTAAEEAVAAAIAGLTDAQWHFKESPGRWSIAQCVEHMTIFNELVTGPVRVALSQAPPSTNPAPDEVILERIPAREQRFSAPPTAIPTGSANPADALARLRKAARGLIEYLEATPDARDHAIPSPPLKAISGGQYELMDGYQWVLAAAGHMQRHTAQALEVKAHPAFPQDRS